MATLKFDQALQSSATTGNGTVVDVRGAVNLTFYTQGTGTVGAGTLQLETAYTSDYSGTWASLATAITLTSVSGGKQAITLVTGPYKYVRARFTADVTGGGSVSCYVVAS